MACPPCYSGCFSCLLSCFNPCYVTCTNAAQGSGGSNQPRSTTAAATTATGFQGANQMLGLLERATVILKQVLDSGNWKGAVGTMRSGTVGCLSSCPRWMQCICNCCYACASGNEEMSAEDVADYLKMLEGQYPPVVLAAAYEKLLEEGCLPGLMEAGFSAFSQKVRQTCNEMMVEMAMLEFTCKIKYQQEAEAKGLDHVDGMCTSFGFRSCQYETFCKTVLLAKNLLNS